MSDFDLWFLEEEFDVNCGTIFRLTTDEVVTAYNETKVLDNAKAQTVIMSELTKEELDAVLDAMHNVSIHLASNA